ncbi:MAG: glycosyltransferase family A protein [Methylotetracoccus sp.]
MPSVSVVIPSYNRAALLREAIASVLAQTFADIEIIVVDDGSTDGTGDVVAEFSRDSRIRYIAQMNAGVSAARNTGIDAATGALVAFLDSDDLWVPDHLARLVAALEQTPDAMFAFANFRFIGDDEEAAAYNRSFAHSVGRFLERAFVRAGDGVRLSGANLLQTLFEIGFPFRIQGSMFRRSFLESWGLRFDPRISYTEEAQLVMEAALRGRCAFVDDPGVLIRRHDENLGDRCYEGKISASYKHRIARMKAVFDGASLSRGERRALRGSMAQMGDYVMRERAARGGWGQRVLAAFEAVRDVPCIASVKCAVKLLLGR